MEARRGIAEVLRDPQGRDRKCLPSLHRPGPEAAVPSEVRPTEFNYPIDINGRWHGSNYRFIRRYRSGFVDNAGWEFDAPFTRLEYVAGDLFHLSYLRHTGQWHRLYCEVSLSQALSLIESDGLLHPH